MAPSICSSWSLESLRGDGGMKPMPLDGAATRASVAKTWSGWSMLMKVGVVVAIVVVVTGISLGIAALAGAFNSDSDEGELKLRKLTYVCADAAETPDYSAILAASGSSYHSVPAWQGTLYTKGSASCVTTYSTYDAAWPPVTSNSSDVPDIKDTEISGITLDMWLDASTGYYHLRVGGCIVYYYNSDHATNYVQGASSAWPIVKADGTGTAAAAPVCS